MCQDCDARILCGNLEALVTLAARHTHDFREHQRINRAYAHTVLKPLLLTLLLGPVATATTTLQYALQLVAKRTFRHGAGAAQTPTAQAEAPPAYVPETVLNAGGRVNLGGLGRSGVSFPTVRSARKAATGSTGRACRVIQGRAVTARSATTQAGAG